VVFISQAYSRIAKRKIVEKKKEGKVIITKEKMCSGNQMPLR
jgi:hypothetical protein